MADISILLDEQNSLVFEVEIQGVSDKKVKPRFIIEADGMDLSFDGKMTGNQVLVDLPILANTLETDQYNVRLEFVVEGEKFFTPMLAQMDAVLPVKVRAGIKGNKKVIEDKRDDIIISGVKQTKVEPKVKQEEVESTSTTSPLLDQEEKQFETKDFNLDFKFSDDSGSFKGYGAMFGNIDSHNDIIQPGAFKKTLQERKNVKLLWQHNQLEPIGTFTKMYEDTNGLVVEGKLALDVKRGQEAYSLMKMGGIEGLSIGYNVVKSTIDRKSNVRHIDEIKLFEVSVVTFPSNEMATISSVKQDENTSYDSLKRIVDTLEYKEPLVDHFNEPGVAHLDKPELKHSDSEDESEESGLNKILNLLHK